MRYINYAPLSNWTSLHVGGKADSLIELQAEDDLKKVLLEQSDSVWLLGYGTNCLISDKGFEGTVVINKAGKIHKLSPTRLKVDSGVRWDDFVQRVVNENLWGLEFTSGIPGGSGAAVAGNIAAYGHKIADSFIEATMFNSSNGSTSIWDKLKFDFDYRQSSLQLEDNSHMFVLDATFELSAAPTSELKYEFALDAADDLGLKPDSLENRRKIILEARRRSGSLLQNVSEGPYTAGSFFKNPIVSQDQVAEIIKFEERPMTKEQLMRQMAVHGENKRRVSAAHVLLAAGFYRGQTWGNVRLHPDHILKIENVGNATATEIYDVVQKILETVKQKLDVELEPEVRFLGEF